MAEETRVPFPTIYKKVREHYDLPETRKERIELISHLLTSGGVHELVANIDKGVSVTRMVKRTPEDGPETSDGPLESALRAEVEEFPIGEMRPDVYLMSAFDVISKRGLRPLSLIAGSRKMFRDWLAIGPAFDMKSLFGIPVVEDGEVPEDVVLLTSYKDDVDTPVFSLKLMTDKPDLKKGRSK